MTLTMSTELDRVLPTTLQTPPRRRVAGRWVRAEGGEWDWYYALPEATRRRVLGHCSRSIGAHPPDVVAHVAGFETVDAWAAELVAAVCPSKKADTWAVSEYPDSMFAADLVGPVEIADMLGVKTDTVYQWVNRGTLPPAWATISGTRLWHRVVVEDWARETGRMPAVETF